MKSFQFLCIFLPFLFYNVACHAQDQTVGIFRNEAAAYDGYTLFAPSFDSTTYLIDNCGRIVHEWKSSYLPGISVYLQEDGTLLRATTIANPVFGNMGGGRVEKVNWNGDLLWEYFYSSPLYQQHHDIAFTPDGNIFLLAFELKTKAEAIAAGRDSLLADNGIWAEHIVEIHPIGKDSGEIVWEWHSWDHMIQDFDPSKNNYGVVSDHPERFDINFTLPGAQGNQLSDWLHANAITYNARLDQLMISSRTFSEFMIIDHSTTSAQAASHQGGLRNKGGDILYRWGNPSSYKRGGQQHRHLYFQHHPHWIPEGLEGAGNILIFNNGTGRPGGDFSSIDEVIPAGDGNGNYDAPGPNGFGPTAAYQSYSDTFYSAFISGAQKLPNGNMLICSGVSGHFFEVDHAGNKVWDYINPVTRLKGKVKQGEPAEMNAVFRAYRLGRDFPAFNGKDLSPKGYVETEPYNYSCEIFLPVTNPENAPSISIYPNPFYERLHLDAALGSGTVVFYNTIGQEVYRTSFSEDGMVYTPHLPGGFYTCVVLNDDASVVQRIRVVKK